MIWKICRKELLRNFQSFRFFALFAVAVFLFAINPFLVSTGYDEKLQEYNRRIERDRTREHTMHSGAAYKYPNPLLFILEGGDEATVSVFGVTLDFGIMAHGVNQYGVNATFPGFQTIDWVFILKILFSLFAMILTFDAISGEKESGTLGLMCSNSVPRASIIIGKYLGALITISIPAAVGMLISMIIVSLLGSAGLTIESIPRIALVMLISFVYISLFVLLGIAISSIVHRSSLSLLLSLSIWIVLVVVIPNLAGIAAESASGVLPEHEFLKRHRDTFGQLFAKWKEISAKKDFKTVEEAQEELSRMMNEGEEQRMRVLDSYRNTIYTNEDLAINVSRISPASAFEFAVAGSLDVGVASQRRFYRATRKYYDLIENYVLKKVGKVRKHVSLPPMFAAKVDGKDIKIAPPSGIMLSGDTSDFPVLPKYRLSVSESIMSGLWNIALLAIWNVVLLLLANMAFLRYDVRQ